VQIIKLSKEALQEKLSKAQNDISRIGSVNLRSLEVYDLIKQEYDKVKEKVDTISNEKEGIMKIIHEIDIRKKRVSLLLLIL
jgi:chromosome segregation ATPase